MSGATARAREVMDHVVLLRVCVQYERARGVCIGGATGRPRQSNPIGRGRGPPMPLHVPRTHARTHADTRADVINGHVRAHAQTRL